MTPKEFAAAVDPEQMLPEVLTTVAKLVSFDTVRRPPLPGMPFGKTTAEALNWLIDLARADGFKAENLDNYCGYIEYGEGEELIAAACHLDVVPAGDPADWNTPPFEMVRDEEFIYGRGVSDNKGPMAVVYQLMREMKKRGVKLHRRFRLIVGCAEETGSECLDHYCAHAEHPVYAFTPDASYPVICGECGILRFALEKRYKPGENRLFLKAGTVINAVPGRADAEYEGKKIHVEGKAAHASHPESGDNALLKLCAELKGKVDSDFPDLVSRLTREDMDLVLSDAVSKLTLVPSLAEADADHAEVQCDIRFPVTMRSKEIVARIEKFVSGTGYTLTIGGVEEPLYFPPDTPFVVELQKIYAEMTGDTESKPLVIGGGTYAKHLPNTVAFGCGFRGHASHAHGPNERRRLANMMLNMRILARAIAVLDELKIRED